MTIRGIIGQYLNKETSAINTIRTLSGMFNPDHAISLLAIINQIARHEEGDLDTEDFKSIYNIE